MKIVVGLDPGITTGIAVFSLKGELKEVFSKKGMSKPEIVRFILSRGSPVVIATDKKKIPKLVEEIASALAVPVFSPEEDLKVKEKNELAKELKPKSSHERDAIAAGLYFFKKNKRKFREIERVLESMGLEMHADRVKELLIKGEAKNLSHALELALGEKVEIKKGEARKREGKKKEKPRKDKLEELERKYEIAQEYIKKLQKRVKELEEQKSKLLEERLKESREIRESVLKEKEIEFRDSIIRNLRAELEKERELRRMLEERLEILEEERVIEARGLVPVVRIREFSREAIQEAKEKYKIFNRVLFFELPCRGIGVAKYLASLCPKAVIGDFGESERETLEERNILVIPKTRISLEAFKHFMGIERGVLEEIAKNERKKGFMEWLERYKKRFL